MTALQCEQSVPKARQARALFAYDATGETELSMREGDVISVLKVHGQPQSLYRPALL